MMENLISDCSISNWFPKFSKDSIDATILHFPEDVLKYIQHDAFILPREASKNQTSNSTEWSDGSPMDNNDSEASECEPTFPEFSKKIQDVIDKFGGVFLKSNWRTPVDAMWVAPTKTLKCTSLDEVYLLLKSSNRILEDMSRVEQLSTNNETIPCCLVLKTWRDINPCTEFRCFVVDNELIGICQRDISQYYKYIESEKHKIRYDIKSFFLEKIKNRFTLDNYTFDVIRYKKDKVKIVDFGSLDDSTTKNTLFTYAELTESILDPPEFRFIAEDVGIQPSGRSHFCVPREINEFFQSGGQSSIIDMIQTEVENQRNE